MDAYVGDSFDRFVHTYGLVAGESGRCLELGANPYFTTFLLDEFSDLDLELANFFDGTKDSITQLVRHVALDGTAAERPFSSKLFNVENDLFPYEEASLDVVLFCEILEHLLMNPLAVLGEIHRILKPNALLVVTTPNVCRLENATRLVDGQNIYDPYSGFGPYGRHNREYTMEEVVFLLAFAGFETEVSFTADGHPTDNEALRRYSEVAPLLADRPDELGAYLYVRARKVRPPREGLPDRLYRSWPQGVIVAPQSHDVLES
jgi:SAM-dependent methyltransferase